jgi:hypothetical protein
MPISKEEFDKGIKPLDKGSQEYKILEFLRAKKTQTPAYTFEEILNSFGVTPEKYKDALDYIDRKIDFLNAIYNLEHKGKILSKQVKTVGKHEYTTYYMAK